MRNPISLFPRLLEKTRVPGRNLPRFCRFPDCIPIHISETENDEKAGTAGVFTPIPQLRRSGVLVGVTAPPSRIFIPFLPHKWNPDQNACAPQKARTWADVS